VENLREPAGFSTFCSVGEQNVETREVASGFSTL
jgi:hypothetical protein